MALHFNESKAVPVGSLISKMKPIYFDLSPGTGNTFKICPFKAEYKRRFTFLSASIKSFEIG